MVSVGRECVTVLQSAQASYKLCSFGSIVTIARLLGEARVGTKDAAGHTETTDKLLEYFDKLVTQYFETPTAPWSHGGSCSGQSYRSELVAPIRQSGAKGGRGGGGAVFG